MGGHPRTVPLSFCMLPTAIACAFGPLILALQEAFAVTTVDSEGVLSTVNRLERALDGPAIDPSLARAARRRLYKIARDARAARANLLRARLDLLSQRAEAIQHIVFRLHPTPAGDVIRVREVLEGVSQFEREWLRESYQDWELLRRE